LVHSAAGDGRPRDDVREREPREVRVPRQAEMIEVTRRRILQSGTLAAASVLVPVGTATAVKTTNLLSRSRFAGLVGSSFTLSSGGRSYACRLTVVGDLVGAPAGDDARFRLTFTTSAAGPGQGVHAFSRPGFASTSLFVIPDPARQQYVAIVNRI
jgi:hypothetical protein